MSLRPETKAEWTDLAMHGGDRGREDCQPGWHLLFGSAFRGKSILDVGAGLGRSRDRLAAGGNRVTLQDPGPGLPIDLRDPVAAIPDGSYDVVTAFDVIEHVLEDEAFLAHLVRIAREHVVLTTPNYDHSRAANPCHCREYTPAQFLRLLAPYAVETYYGGDGPGREVGLTTASAEEFARHGFPSHAAVVRAGAPA